MNKFLLPFLLLNVACVSQNTQTTDVRTFQHASVSPLIDQSSPAGEKILKTGRHMALTSKEIIRGSCWDYINTVYNRSGYPQSKRHYVLKGKKNKGPYAKPNRIRAGDWLYFVNHSYNNSPHSGIFVKWVDKKKRIASILSYGGQSRKKPGRYRNYNLSHVYTIIRAKD